MKDSRIITIAVIYLSLFLDNVLLTVVGRWALSPERGGDLKGIHAVCHLSIYRNVSVPIIPDYLFTLDANTTMSGEEDENGRVGLLLSSKALVQLIWNPIVGTLIGKLGYARPLFLGNLSLFLATLCKLHK